LTNLPAVDSSIPSLRSQEYKKIVARDIMKARFHTLSPRDTIAEAVKHFQIALKMSRKKYLA
jgi:hypothetical protein